jgi:hypothetical protein
MEPQILVADDLGSPTNDLTDAQSAKAAITRSTRQPQPLADAPRSGPRPSWKGFRFPCKFNFTPFVDVMLSNPRPFFFNFFDLASPSLTPTVFVLDVARLESMQYNFSPFRTILVFATSPRASVVSKTSPHFSCLFAPFFPALSIWKSYLFSLSRTLTYKNLPPLSPL